MPVPASINDLSTTAGSNSPAGSESPTTVDDYLRTLSAFIATLRDENASQATAIGGRQPSDPTLTALAGLATGADKLPYFTGTDKAGQTTLTAFARTLLDDADDAAARATLDVYSKAEANGIALGVGQTWQDVTASRSPGTIYTNTTGRTIYVLISANVNTTSNFAVDGVSITVIDGNPGVSIISLPIPNGSQYRLASLTDTIGFKWLELR